VKIADFSWVIVGPTIVRELAEHGATVIHVESHRHPDTGRVIGPFKDNKPSIDSSAWYAIRNANKYGISLDLNKEINTEIIINTQNIKPSQYFFVMQLKCQKEYFGNYLLISITVKESSYKQDKQENSDKSTISSLIEQQINKVDINHHKFYEPETGSYFYNGKIRKRFTKGFNDKKEIVNVNNDRYYRNKVIRIKPNNLVYNQERIRNINNYNGYNIYNKYNEYVRSSNEENEDDDFHFKTKQNNLKKVSKFYRELK